MIFVSSGILGTVLTSADVKQRAREIGFDACGIAPATELPELSALATWLEQGHAGEMLYLHSRRRRAPISAASCQARGRSS